MSSSIGAPIDDAPDAVTVLLLVGGSPGTGKSTLATRLAAELAWAVIRSDEVRLELVGAAAQTYPEMFRRAETMLSAGTSVILDATFASAGSRAMAAAVATRSASRLLALRCTASRSKAAARVRARPKELAYGSEAAPRVAGQITDRFDPWPEATAIDTRGSAELTARLAMVALHLWQREDQRP